MLATPSHSNGAKFSSDSRRSNISAPNFQSRPKSKYNKEYQVRKGLALQKAIKHYGGQTKRIERKSKWYTNRSALIQSLFTSSHHIIF